MIRPNNQIFIIGVLRLFYSLKDLKCRFYSTKKILKVYPLHSV